MIKYAVIPLAVITFALSACRNTSQRHHSEAECSFITSGWFEASEDNSELRPAIFVKIIGNNIYWNKDIISENKLNQFVDFQRKLDPQPMIIFDYKISGKNCKFASKIQAKIDTGIDCKNNKLCGFGSRDEWKRIR